MRRTRRMRRIGKMRRIRRIRRIKRMRMMRKMRIMRRMRTPRDAWVTHGRRIHDTSRFGVVEKYAYIYIWRERGSKLEPQVGKRPCGELLKKRIRVQYKYKY